MNTPKDRTCTACRATKAAHCFPSKLRPQGRRVYSRLCNACHSIGKTRRDAPARDTPGGSR